MDKRASRRQAKSTFKALCEVSPVAATWLKDREPEIIAYLETAYQDWDNPQQEKLQRRCR